LSRCWVKVVQHLAARPGASCQKRAVAMATDWLRKMYEATRDEVLGGIDGNERLEDVLDNLREMKPEDLYALTEEQIARMVDKPHPGLEKKPVHYGGNFSSYNCNSDGDKFSDSDLGVESDDSAYDGAKESRWPPYHQQFFEWERILTKLAEHPENSVSAAAKNAAAHALDAYKTEDAALCKMALHLAERWGERCESKLAFLARLCEPLASIGQEWQQPAHQGAQKRKSRAAVAPRSKPSASQASGGKAASGSGVRKTATNVGN